MTFDPTKPVQTRSGLPARILSTDFDGGRYSIVSVVRLPSGREVVRTYTPEGLFIAGSKKETDRDLVNVPEFIGQAMFDKSVSDGQARYYNTGLGHLSLPGAIGASKKEWPILKVVYGPNGVVESARLLKEGEE